MPEGRVTMFTAAKYLKQVYRSLLKCRGRARQRVWSTSVWYGGVAGLGGSLRDQRLNTKLYKQKHFPPES